MISTNPPIIIQAKPRPNLQRLLGVEVQVIAAHASVLGWNMQKAAIAIEKRYGFCDVQAA